MFKQQQLSGPPASLHPEAISLRNLDRARMAEALAPLGIEAQTASRIFSRVHRLRARDDRQAESFEDIAGLSGDKRRALRAHARFDRLEVVDRREASDGFAKYLFRLADGPVVEAVRIPLPAPAEARALKKRRLAGEVSGLQPLPTAKYTVCVSSQAGCALACDFCETGRLGAIRNLRPWEILAQIETIAAEAPHPVRGVVFMGMGEPFLNYDNVMTAAGILCDPAGPAISASAITISTAGVVPLIRRYTEEGHRYRLVFSLGAPNSTDRAQLMPIEKRWPLEELMSAIRAYATATRTRATLAYVGCGGLNLSAAHAEQLVNLTKGLRARVNLIPVTDESGRYRPPSEAEIKTFFNLLSAAGIPVVRRYSGGQEIAASCGTLAGSARGGRNLRLPLVTEPNGSGGAT